MRSALRIILAAAGIAMPGVAHAELKPTWKTETYSVTGNSGIELYRAIGENGPKVGVGRVIAYTTFDLKWSRKYVPSGGGCTLTTARPHLVIITKLPKAGGKLPAGLKERWQTFLTGIEAHERVHADFIIEMVKAIENLSVGFSVPDDPNCKKIREELTARLAVLSQEQRQKSREFDQVEMSDGGNVHRLVLALVNGD